MTLIPFGEFAGGVMDGGDLVVGSASKQTDPHLQITQGALGGGYFGRFVGDASASDGVNIRVYLRGVKGNANPAWLTPGHEFWRTYTIRQPSSASYQGGFYSADNLHQSSDYGVTGPAIVNEGPANGTGQPWSTVLRGSNTRGLANDPFTQTNLGLPKSYGANIAWAGGNHNVTADEWITFLRGEYLDYNGNGWVELWARWPGLSDWRNVIPRAANVYTSYNNWNYPVCGMYVVASYVGAKTAQIDICHGALADNKTEALNFANARNGYTSQPPPPSGVTLDQLAQEADAISTTSPKVRKFAQDVVAYLRAHS